MKKGQDKLPSPQNNIWLTVKKDLEAKIIAGKYSAGHRIPTIVELMEQYNIGKTTAQKVINALCNDGIIVKKVGVGCFVQPSVKERLFEHHEKELKEKARSTIEEACLLGHDKEHVMKMIDENWDAISEAVERPSV
jgi:DNA-binding GntR family transcriptional regulator